MNKDTFHIQNENITSLKFMVLVIFFLVLSSNILSASSNIIESLGENDLVEYENLPKANFEITANFISTWQVKEIRDYSVIEVIQTGDFKLAYEITEQLRKFVNEPILVNHGYENNSIVYTIIIGRFSNVDEAVKYHDMLK